MMFLRTRRGRFSTLIEDQGTNKNLAEVEEGFGLGEKNGVLGSVSVNESSLAKKNECVQLSSFLL